MIFAYISFSFYNGNLKKRITLSSDSYILVDYLLYQTVRTEQLNVVQVVDLPPRVNEPVRLTKEIYLVLEKELILEQGQVQSY